VTEPDADLRGARRRKVLVGLAALPLALCLLSALVPISIIAGAIFLFKTMEATGAMPRIRKWLNAVTDSRVAQLMIIGWAFSFMIEGASGFGTPAALAGPILVGLGFPALRVAVFCLVMNSVPVSFGAVGNMICINNIVAICAILGISQYEGRILRFNAIPMFFYGLVAIGSAVLLF